MWFLYIFIIVIIFGLTLWTKWQNLYFKKKGMNALRVYDPIIGNAINIFLYREHSVDFYKRVCELFPNDKYFGIRNFTQPVIMIKDLEVIKLITVKAFDHFMDHFSTIDEKVDQTFGPNLLSLRGQKWKDMRATLSPAFTSSKMRGMFDFVNECAEQMAKFFLNELEMPENKDKKYIDVELKELFSRYANDVIATAAFGVKVNSLQDRENEFYKMGKEATDFSGTRLFKIMAIQMFPRIAKIFNIGAFGSKLAKFFKDLVNDSFKMREEQGIVRLDMIHLLMEAKKGLLKYNSNETHNKDIGFSTAEDVDLRKHTHTREWTENEIIAQAFIFFFAGFETSSSVLSFMGYELTKNPDIQKRLQEEIDTIMEKNDGKVKYDDIKEMKYMDMVVSETLRYWPPSLFSDRQCTKPYTLPPSNDKSSNVEVNIGELICIPVHTIHHDPQYYKDPEKFDPERFSDENKHEINPLAYMPFGVGPRNCIGSRFALMEIKLVIFYMLHHFNFIVTEKTEIPLSLKEKSVIFLMPKNGFWIGLSSRK